MVQYIPQRDKYQRKDHSLSYPKVGLIKESNRLKFYKDISQNRGIFLWKWKNIYGINRLNVENLTMVMTVTMDETKGPLGSSIWTPKVIMTINVLMDSMYFTINKTLPNTHKIKRVIYIPSCMDAWICIDEEQE